MKTDNVVLTIYSSNYDNYSNVMGNGMNGKIFLGDGKNGIELKSVEKALDYICNNSIKLSEVVYMFQRNGEQFFRRFKLAYD